MAFTDIQKRDEIISCAQREIEYFFRTTRGANMFGPGARTRISDPSVLDIYTSDGFYQLKIERVD